jgi:hypothetical protein
MCNLIMHKRPSDANILAYRSDEDLGLQIHTHTHTHIYTYIHTHTNTHEFLPIFIYRRFGVSILRVVDPQYARCNIEQGLNQTSGCNKTIQI